MESLLKTCWMFRVVSTWASPWVSPYSKFRILMIASSSYFLHLVLSRITPRRLVLTSSNYQITPRRLAHFKLSLRSGDSTLLQRILCSLPWHYSIIRHRFIYGGNHWTRVSITVNSQVTRVCRGSIWSNLQQNSVHTNNYLYNCPVQTPTPFGLYLTTSLPLRSTASPQPQIYQLSPTSAFLTYILLFSSKFGFWTSGANFVQCCFSSEHWIAKYPETHPIRPVILSYPILVNTFFFKRNMLQRCILLPWFAFKHMSSYN